MLPQSGKQTERQDRPATADKPYHARRHRDCYSNPEREYGSALEPSPGFVKPKGNRHEIKKQRQQK
jgi:hypothetical protein